MPEPPADVAGRRTWPRWALASGLLAAIVAFYTLGLQDHLSWPAVRAGLGDWQAAVNDHLLSALLVFFLVYVAVTALSLPVASLVTLVAGALFGRWLGTAVVSLASTIGAVLAFLSSRYILRDWVERRLGGRLENVRLGIQRDGAYYLLTLRLVPLFPFWLVNLGMGLTRMPVWTFAAVSMLGMLPGTFVYVLAGEALATVDSPSAMLSTQVVVALALLGVMPLVIRLAVRKLQARRDSE
jgi:uncharacterized membrane protein YdjX (TVP38/TMEM64 family)